MSGRTLQMQQRYYDPVAGRFLSVDPVTRDANTGGGFGRYHYANTNPYGFVDPDGRLPKLGDCGWAPSQCQSYGEKSNGARETAVTAGVALGTTAAAAFATGCTVGTGGVCALGGFAILSAGAAGGALLGGGIFDAVQWLGQLTWSTGANSAGGERVRGLPPDGVAPPANGEVKPGPASRQSERDKGGQSLWDGKGGEWRYSPEDKHHNPHWDYNPHDRPSSPWQNVPIGSSPPRK